MYETSRTNARIKGETIKVFCKIGTHDGAQNCQKRMKRSSTREQKVINDNQTTTTSLYAHESMFKKKKS